MRQRKRGEKILFFDEFAVANRPNTYYGWAEKNTRPQVPSDESKKREKLNGLLAVDAVSGEEFLRLLPFRHKSIGIQPLKSLSSKDLSLIILSQEGSIY